MKAITSRSILQSVVCLLLCPLLGAQQTASAVLPSAPETISQPAVPAQTTVSGAAPAITGQPPERILVPRGTLIGFYTLDPVSSATAAVGSTVRLVLAKNFAPGGVTMLRAGTVVPGTVTQVRRGVAGKTSAQLEISVGGIPLGKNLTLKLDTQMKTPGKQIAREASFWILGAPLVVLALPLIIAMAVGDKKQKPTGGDLVYEACTYRLYFVASDTMIQVSSVDLAALSAASVSASGQSACPKTRPTACDGSTPTQLPGSQCSSSPQPPDFQPTSVPLL
jgi:hypothetical protein